MARRSLKHAMRYPSQRSPLAIGLFSWLLLTICGPTAVVAQDRGPQVYRSTNFIVMTDLPAEEAEALVERLESMLKLVVGYWGRQNRKPIRMYVIDRINNWPDAQLAQLNPEGVQSAIEEAGLTITQTRSLVGGPKIDADSVVYATARRQTPQHEAIHAYCGINFGTSGPLWYSEGMAEVGKYWRVGERGVNASDYVIEYLKSQDPKPLEAIINSPLERTGDSWQNYAWRWVLCHLLGANTNYAPRFKPLGLALLADRKVSFDSVYGSQLREIEFEYQLFLQDLTPGYRCDLCSWDWKAKPRAITEKNRAFSRIDAAKGWQASKGLVRTGASYTLEIEGTWRLSSDGEELSAAGDDTGRGRLLGIIFDDYQLSEPFELGAADSFIAPGSGHLFLRCADDWGQLADNKGTINVRIGLDVNRAASTNPSQSTTSGTTD